MTNESIERPTLQDAVRGYYDDHALSDDALARVATGSRRRSSRPVAWAIAGTLAATLAVAALTLGVTGRAWLAPPAAVDAAPGTPRLVAVQIHAEWCARSPEVAPLFAELLTRYGNEPVLFVTLDITDDVRRGQAELLSANLGIEQAFGEPFESGMIKLIDRESDTLLAAITGREQAAELEFRIAEVLDGVGEDGQDENEG